LTAAEASRYYEAMRTLITGGIKSGKSRHALLLAEEFTGPRSFLATAEALDEEMAAKIRRHQEERGGRFRTIEEPLLIHEKLEESMVLDCLTLWVNNVLYYGKEGEFDSWLGAFIERLPRDIVIVTNEVGMGFVPLDPLSRKYGVMLGTANARVAAACDRLVLMVAGQGLRVK
jgi:adenosylcobinamide kinase/adenosylcobinamide-phosphate guanylyltransferase